MKFASSVAVVVVFAVALLCVPASAGSCHGTPVPPAVKSEPVDQPIPATHVGVAVDVETASPAAVTTSVLVNGEEVAAKPAVQSGGGAPSPIAAVSMGSARRNARKDKRATIHEARDLQRAARLGGKATEAANQAAVNERVRQAYAQ
jgi:hypothetical protein